MDRKGKAKYKKFKEEKAAQISEVSKRPGAIKLEVMESLDALKRKDEKSPSTGNYAMQRKTKTRVPNYQAKAEDIGDKAKKVGGLSYADSRMSTKRHHRRDTINTEDEKERKVKKVPSIRENTSCRWSLPVDSLFSNLGKSFTQSETPGAFSVDGPRVDSTTVVPTGRNEDENYLVPTAHLVEGSVIVAEKIHEVEERKKRGKVRTILISLLLCSAIAGVSFLIINGLRSDNDEPPETKNPLSKKLLSIEKRGTLRCGTESEKYIQKIEEALCQSFANAIFNKSNSSELVSANRAKSFTSLKDGSYDLLFTASYTAENEIYEPSSQSTLNFASLPYLMIGDDTFTIATNSDDQFWSKLLSWIFESLIQAEESEITKETARLIKPNSVFGAKYKYVFRNAVQANGNYGEIWAKTMPIKRSGKNLINKGSSGLLSAFPIGNINTIGPEPEPNGTIDTIINRGYLNCGMAKRPGYSMYNVTSKSSYGFEVDLCRAIVAALFNGDDKKFKVVEHIYDRRFKELDDGEVDVAFGFTHTLQRTINESSTLKGYNFSPTYIHDGLGFAGIEKYTKCVEDGNFTGECKDTKICVLEKSTWHEVVKNVVKAPAPNVKESINFDEVIADFIRGVCNVMAGETPDLSEKEFREVNRYDGKYYVGIQKFSKEPVGIVTRSDDMIFSKLVKWILYGLIHAEQRKITQENASQMPSTRLFGKTLTKIFQDPVRAVGNYGSIYDRHIESMLTRKESKNLLNTGGPLLIANAGILKI